MNVNQIVWLDFDYMNEHYKGEAMPALSAANNSLFPAFDIYFNNEYSGTVIKDDNHWISDNRLEAGILKIIGRQLSNLFNS